MMGNPPARLMRGARCERIIERGSELTVRFCGQVAAIRVRELKASDSGDIYAELERVT
jgi:hypothetical protein